jgi:hypothetical protein
MFTSRGVSVAPLQDFINGFKERYAKIPPIYGPILNGPAISASSLCLDFVFTTVSSWEKVLLRKKVFPRRKWTYFIRCFKRSKIKIPLATKGERVWPFFEPLFECLKYVNDFVDSVEGTTRPGARPTVCLFAVRGFRRQRLRNDKPRHWTDFRTA